MPSQLPSPPPTEVKNRAETNPGDELALTNRGPYPPFGALTGLYEKLSNESKHELRRKLLANWFRVSVVCADVDPCSNCLHQKWREDVGPDLYPVLRLLLPQVTGRILICSSCLVAIALSIIERPRTSCVQHQREDAGKDIHPADPLEHERR